MRVALTFLTSLVLLVGCATNKIDWNARVGQYSYDDAVVELGVPDRTATLTDGTTVAEWLQVRGSSYATYHGFHRVGFQTFDINQFPDSYLRLIFGPDKRLVRVEKFAR